jgi:hypothetical protein
MNNFWMSFITAQNAAAGAKPANSRHRVLQAAAGIALSVLIVAGLVIAEMVNR